MSFRPHTNNPAVKVGISLEELLAKCVKRECDYIFDDIIAYIEHNHLDECWKEQILEIEWEKVENFEYCDAVTIADVIRDVFGYELSNDQIDELLKVYENTETGYFDYQRMLVAFFKRLDHYHQLHPHDTIVSSSPGSSKHWQILKRKLTFFAAINKFQASAEELARQRALTKLVDALGHLSNSRFGLSVTPFGSAELPKKDFRKAMKRVFNIELTELEANALFDVLDDDGNGSLSAQEFASKFKQFISEYQKRSISDKAAKLEKRSQSMMELPSINQNNNGRIASIFDKNSYKSAIIKLSNVFEDGDHHPLMITDDQISAIYARKYLNTHFGVGLTREEMESICYKLNSTCKATKSTNDLNEIKGQGSGSGVFIDCLYGKDLKMLCNLLAGVTSKSCANSVSSKSGRSTSSKRLPVFR